MATPLDPTALGFLLAENRRMPMHVGGLQLYRKPPDAGRNYVRDLFESMRDTIDIAPLFLKRPYRSIKTAGQWVWVEDDQFDIDHHVRHSALPKPGRVRELFELCSRLHSTRLATERPLWEWHLIEGLRDGRIAMYTKLHHSLVDGIAAMRLLQSIVSSDPDERDMPAPWAKRPPRSKIGKAQEAAEHATAGEALSALKTALGISADAAGIPKALVQTLNRSLRNETSTLALFAPNTILNREITASRRFAAQDWPLERIRAIGKATGTTLNDVVLAMCSGAMRTYLSELDALPETSLIAMVPVGLHAKARHAGTGGNAVGSIMVKLGTDLEDPLDRLLLIHASMLDGKQALAQMTPLQIQAMSAVGQVPAILPTLLGMTNMVRPAYNLVISNVPGPRTTQYFNGAEMLGTYPLSVPIDGNALNITCNSYAEQMAFGLTGCRRTVPHLQRILTYLDDEISALEKVAGV
ncbi:wax ester/triacylglycerol synthase family O-acyltransferase [Nocardioides agariphilus]|uniref:Diacylglycerol O-acyltransferase n=1 Tax=Nocardioides agariphilus TaxID=433664 RepID=A0A930VT87_9ACTN|nr:wax ester/triacylglycerol synthase family O-acyltransferase [Nocardioides agariphilus]